jgi:hypothetical protein
LQEVNVGDSVTFDIQMTFPGLFNSVTLSINNKETSIEIKVPSHLNVDTCHIKQFFATPDTFYIQVIGNLKNETQISKNAILIVKGLFPKISKQSDSLLNIGVNKPCTLSVAATGTFPLQYQWYLGSNKIKEAVSINFSLPSTQKTDEGSYTCVVSNIWGADTTNPIRIATFETNIAPQWKSDTLHITVKENENVSVNLNDSCSDKDNDSLSFKKLTSTFKHDSLLSNGRLTLTTDYEDSGTYTDNFEITDSKLSAKVVIVIKVINVNREPFFIDSLPLESYLISEGALLSIRFKASDPDNDKLKYFVKATTLIHKNDITINDSLLQWESTINDNNVYSLTLAVTDGIDTSLIEIHIGVGSVNLPPVISISGITRGQTVSVKELDTLKLMVQGTDPNTGDKVVLLSMKNAPFIAVDGSYDTVTGLFKYIPTSGVSTQESNKSFPDVIFYAKDSYGSIDSFKISIVVVNSNRTPVIALQQPLNGALAIARTDTIKWGGTDSDNDTLTYSLYVGTLPDQLELVYNGKNTFFWQNGYFINAQKYYWKVIVDDGKSQSESIVRNFTINNPPRCFVVNAS